MLSLWSCVSSTILVRPWYPCEQATQHLVVMSLLQSDLMVEEVGGDEAAQTGGSAGEQDAAVDVLGWGKPLSSEVRGCEPCSTAGLVQSCQASLIFFHI